MLIIALRYSPLYTLKPEEEYRIGEVFSWHYFILGKSEGINLVRKSGGISG